MITEKSVVGCLIGTAVGDSLGLCCEAMSAVDIKKVYGEITKHNFFFGKGMISDDTEHTCMVAYSLLLSKFDEDIFTKTFANKLKRWLLCIPAGVGKATLAAILKMCLGFSKEHCGIFSAGNGPAMRSAIIGVCCGEDMETLKRMVKASTKLTHTDPKAYYGALAVAIAAHLSSIDGKISPSDYFNKLESTLKNEQASEFLEVMKKVVVSVSNGDDSKAFVESMGLNRGISGYTYHTVPVVLHCWLRNQSNFKNAITEIISFGGDTDTTAAILGGIIGAKVGKEGIPKEWIEGIYEWLYSVGWMEEMGGKLSAFCRTGIGQQIELPPIHRIVLRNLFFLFIVLCHGVKRLFY